MTIIMVRSNKNTINIQTDGQKFVIKPPYVRPYLSVAFLVVMKYQIIKVKKGKVIPLQARCDPEGG